MAAINEAAVAYGEALATTMRNYVTKEPINQLYTEHPLFDTLTKNAKSDSGEEMVIPIVGGSVEGPVFSNASGRFVADVDNNIYGMAKYGWSGVQVGKTRLPYQDLLKNKGNKTRIQDRLAGHKQDLREQFKVAITTLMHTPDANLPAQSFDSLDSICNEAVAVHGGIDSSVATFWKPVTIDLSLVTDPIKAIRLLVRTITKNANGVRPDILHVGETLWNALDEYADARSSLDVTSGKLNFGWESRSWNGVEIRWDYDQPDDRIYALTSRFLHWRWLEDDFLKVHEPREVQEFDAGVLYQTVDFVYPMTTTLAIGTSQRRAQGMGTGFTG